VEKLDDSLQFDLATIEAATNNFLEDNKLGTGGFGEVYKVRLISILFIFALRIHLRLINPCWKYRTHDMIEGEFVLNLNNKKRFKITNQIYVLESY